MEGEFSGPSLAGMPGIEPPGTDSRRVAEIFPLFRPDYTINQVAFVCVSHFPFQMLQITAQTRL